MNTTSMDCSHEKEHWLMGVSVASTILLFVSEALPFLRRKDKANGIAHLVVCLLRNSECLARVLRESIENPQEDLPIP